MEWFIAILAVAVLGLAAAAASGGLGEFGPFKTDRPQLVLPESDLTATDLARVRFAVVPRGYAMNQVDQLLDRLQRQLGDPPEVTIGPGSGIMETEQVSDIIRNHNGSDETSYG